MTPAAPHRTAWLIGGGLLVLTALLDSAQPMLLGAGEWTMGVGVASDVLFAAAMVVFAFGVGGGGSVVRRRPLGVTALLVLGVWPLFVTGFWTLIPPIEQWAYGPLTVFGDLSVAVQLAAAIVAVVQVARAAVVPGPGRWAPLAALVLVVAAQAAVSVVAFGVARVGGTQILTVAVAFASLASFVAVAGLGIVAIVLALRPEERPAEDRTVQVYPPTA